jgi:hypothetical protein
MSAISGTATNYLDLLNKLRTFLTTDATLTGLGQNWTELATTSAPYSITELDGQVNTIEFETFLKAPGLSTTEQIYINIGAYTNAGTGLFNWRMKGAIGYINANNFFNQPGTSPDTFMYLWNATIPYWFIANGQRVIVAAQVSAEYESIYLGKFLPDGTPGQYPYPLFIGGGGGNSSPISNPQGQDFNAMSRTHSDVSNFHAAFFDPACCFLMDPSSAWQVWNHWNGGSDAHASSQNNMIWPYGDDGTSGNGQVTNGTAGGMKWMTTNLDGSYPLIPVRLEQVTPSINLMGTLDGVFATTGDGNSPGSTLTVGGSTYLVVQDTFRSARQNFAAFLYA